MTAINETFKAPGGPAKRPARRPAGTGFTGSFIATLGLTAILVWLSGIALNRGFGVHLPFVAGFILVLAGLQVVKLAAGEVAHAWHVQAIAAAPRYTAAAAAGAFIAQAEIEAALDAKGFPAVDEKIRDAGEKHATGGYL